MSKHKQVIVEKMTYRYHIQMLLNIHYYHYVNKVVNIVPGGHRDLVPQCVRSVPTGASFHKISSQNKNTIFWVFTQDTLLQLN